MKTFGRRLNYALFVLDAKFSSKNVETLFSILPSLLPSPVM